MQFHRSEKNGSDLFGVFETGQPATTGFSAVLQAIVLHRNVCKYRKSHFRKVCICSLCDPLCAAGNFARKQCFLLPDHPQSGCHRKPTDGCMGEIMPVVINTKTCIDADDSCTCTAENAAEYPQRGCSFCHKTLLFMRCDLVLNEEPAYTPVHRFDR